MRKLAARHAREQVEARVSINKAWADNSQLLESLKDAQRQAQRSHFEKRKDALGGFGPCQSCGEQQTCSPAAGDEGRSECSFQSLEEEAELAGLFGRTGSSDAAIQAALAERLDYHLGRNAGTDADGKLGSEALRRALRQMGASVPVPDDSAREYRDLAHHALEAIVDLEQRLQLSNCAQMGLADMLVQESDQHKAVKEMLLAGKADVLTLTQDLAAKDATIKALLERGKADDQRSNGGLPAPTTTLAEAMEKLRRAGEEAKQGEGSSKAPLPEMAPTQVKREDMADEPQCEAGSGGQGLEVAATPLAILADAFPMSKLGPRADGLVSGGDEETLSTTVSTVSSPFSELASPASESLPLSSASPALSSENSCALPDLTSLPPLRQDRSRSEPLPSSSAEFDWTASGAGKARSRQMAASPAGAGAVEHTTEAELQRRLRRKEEASRRAQAELQAALEQKAATLRESDLALAASQHKVGELEEDVEMLEEVLNDQKRSEGVLMQSARQAALERDAALQELHLMQQRLSLERSTLMPERQRASHLSGIPGHAGAAPEASARREDGAPSDSQTKIDSSVKGAHPNQANDTGMDEDASGLVSWNMAKPQLSVENSSMTSGRDGLSWGDPGSSRSSMTMSTSDNGSPLSATLRTTSFENGEQQQPPPMAAGFSPADLLKSAISKTFSWRKSGKVKAEGTPPSREPPPSPLRHLYPVRIRTSASASMASGEAPLKPLHYLKRTRAADGGAGEGSAQGSGSPRSSDTGRQASLPTSESGRPSFFRPHASSVYDDDQHLHGGSGISHSLDLGEVARLSHAMEKLGVSSKAGREATSSLAPRRPAPESPRRHSLGAQPRRSATASDHRPQPSPSYFVRPSNSTHQGANPGEAPTAAGQAPPSRKSFTRPASSKPGPTARDPGNQRVRVGGGSFRFQPHNSEAAGRNSEEAGTSSFQAASLQAGLQALQVSVHGRSSGGGKRLPSESHSQAKSARLGAEGEGSGSQQDGWRQDHTTLPSRGSNGQHREASSQSRARQPRREGAAVTRRVRGSGDDGASVGQLNGQPAEGDESGRSASRYDSKSTWQEETMAADYDEDLSNGRMDRNLLFDGDLTETLFNAADTYESDIHASASGNLGTMDEANRLASQALSDSVSARHFAAKVALLDSGSVSPRERRARQKALVDSFAINSDPALDASSSGRQSPLHSPRSEAPSSNSSFSFDFPQAAAQRLENGINTAAAIPQQPENSAIMVCAPHMNGTRGSHSLKPAMHSSTGETPARPIDDGIDSFGGSSSTSEGSLDEYFDMGINFSDIANDTRRNQGSTTDEPLVRNPADPVQQGRTKPYTQHNKEQWKGLLRSGSIEKSSLPAANREEYPGALRLEKISKEPDFLSEENAGIFPFPVPQKRSP